MKLVISGCHQCLGLMSQWGKDTQAGDQGQLTFPGKMFTLPRAEVAKVNLVKQVPRQMTPNLVKEQRACTGMWDTSHQFKGVFLR